MRKLAEIDKSVGTLERAHGAERIIPPVELLHEGERVTSVVA
jgi:hypothetical protein